MGSRDVSRSFDAIIIGAGQAGPPLAGRLTGAGMSVALVERKQFGGTCVNTGCMPTKALVACARAAHVARRGADWGVMIDGGIGIDMTRVQARGDTVASTARGNVETWLRGMKNLTVIEGHARFENPTEIRAGAEVLKAPRIFINVGGRAVVPDFPGIGEVPYLTNSSILALKRLPRHLVVVGGSYIGLEFAQMFRRFGAAVTIVEKGARLIGREDEDVSEAIRDILAAEGIDIRTGADCIGFARHADGVSVRIGAGGEVVGSDVLLATGRRPNTDDLGLEAAGVAVNERGHIEVDDSLATSQPGIWALGDCNGRGAFTHTAYNDFEIVAANLLDGASRRVSQRIQGYALYIDPPLGRAGMTETEARRSGRRILVSKRPMSRVGRAVERDETAGFMKLVADAETKEILGAAILGVEGDEAIHAVLNPMNAGATYEALKWAVPIHPTVSELLPTLASGLEAG